MKRLATLLLPVITAAAGIAQTPREQLAALPDSLVDGAHSVVLNYELTYAVENDRSASVSHDLEILLLDGHHDDIRQFVEYFDGDSRITRMTASSVGPDGSEFRARKADFTERKALSEVNFLDDYWYRSVEVPCSAYPCTVRYASTKKLSDFGAMDFPDWLPAIRKQGLRRAKYTALVPLENELLFRGKLLPEPTVNDDGKVRRYQWNLLNVPPQSEEPLAPVARETLPYLRVALADFRIDDYRGSFRDWATFGGFIGTLMEGRDQLPERLAREVREEVAGTDAVAEKVRRLYRLLQRKTRYVSVQLGIGGWQPFSAEYVDQNAFGDCKALSNFMGAMLREVDIVSYPVLIYRGDRVRVPLAGDFATSAFNHMVLYVPALDQYLECTSKYSPTGYLATDIRDRSVLWITPEGGKLARTPSGESGENGHTRTVDLELTAEQEVSYSMHSTYFGSDQELFRGLEAYLADESDQLDWLHRNGILPDVTGEQYRLTVAADRAEAEISYRTTLRNRVRKLGRRQFLPILTDPFDRTLDRVEQRTLPVETTQARTLIDTVNIAIPSGWEVESGVPDEPVTIEHDVGSYRSEIRPTERGYRYVRVLRLRAVRLPAARYADVRDFYAGVNKAERAQLVLREKRTK